MAAWKARGDVSMMVEMTTDLCECWVQDRIPIEEGGAHCQTLALQYSTVITR